MRQHGRIFFSLVNAMLLPKFYGTSLLPLTLCLTVKAFVVVVIIPFSNNNDNTLSTCSLFTSTCFFQYDHWLCFYVFFWSTQTLIDKGEPCMFCYICSATAFRLIYFDNLDLLTTESSESQRWCWWSEAVPFDDWQNDPLWAPPSSLEVKAVLTLRGGKQIDDGGVFECKVIIVIANLWGWRWGVMISRNRQGDRK